MNERLEQIRLENMKELGFGVESMKRLKACTVCGRASPREEAFCKECGARLPKETLFDIYKERHTVCRRCETVISRESEFCPQCGKKTESDSNQKTKEGM